MEHRNFLCQFRNHYSVVAGYSYEIIEQFHVTDIIVVHICIYTVRMSNGISSEIEK